MRVIQDAVEYSEPPVFANNPVITIGNFDGVHKGHRALIQNAMNMAKKTGSPLVILTFWPHTGSLVANRSIGRIYTEDQKLALLKEFAPEAEIVQLAFDDHLRQMPEDLFFSEILINRYHMRGLAVGENFRYGYLGTGDAKSLKKHCLEEGIPFEDVAGICVNHRTVSSTWIRELLTEGNIEKANELLDRNYYAESIVQHGKHLGSTLGFPTANLLLPEGLTVPKHGVYLTKVWVPEGSFYGITNLGINPTVEHGNQIKIETHLLDYQGDLYGKTIRVEFLHFQREEQRFHNVEELKARVMLDIEQARHLIESNGGNS